MVLVVVDLMSISHLLGCIAVLRISYMCLLVCHDGVPCKVAERIEMPFGIWTRGGPKKPCIRWGVDPPMGTGKGVAHCKV